MNKTWKTAGKVIALSMLLCVSVAHADNAKERRSRYAKKKAEKKEECAKPVHSHPRKESSNEVITPPVTPIVKCGENMWFQFDALYMRPSEDGLNSGVQTETPARSFVKGSVENAKYGWNWGVRGGVGYNTPHDGWDIIGKWTWFQAKNEQNHSINDSSNVFLTSVSTYGPAFAAVPSQVSITALSLSTKLRLRINIGDLELGREFFISKWLKLRPHVGTRGLWISQALYTNVEGILNNNSSATAGSIDSQLHNANLVKQKYTQNCKGAGLYAGVNTEWGFAKGWSLYGLFDQSLIYARNSTKFVESKTAATIAEYTRSHVTNGENVVRSITDISLGFRWNRLLKHDRLRILLQLGWEEHLFYNFNEFALYNRHGNLSLSGASFQARLDF